MRVERLQHPSDGAVDERVRLDLLDIVLVNRAEGGREGPVLLEAVTRGGRPAPDPPSGEGGRQDRHERHEPESQPGHDPMLADNLHAGNEFRRFRRALPG